MDEQTWLTNRDTGRIPERLQNHFSDRKRRLFVVTACRIEKLEEIDPRIGLLLDVSERIAEGDATVTMFDLFSAKFELHEVHFDLLRSRRDDDFTWIERANSLSEDPIRLPPFPGKGWLLRDIFGNPFRPVVFNSAWRSEAAVGIARGIYEDHAFERLPILADALQEAGCEHPDILAHCREPGTHVRGCWVVDLVLGKE